LFFLLLDFATGASCSVSGHSLACSAISVLSGAPPLELVQQSPVSASSVVASGCSEITDSAGASASVIDAASGASSSTITELSVDLFFFFRLLLRFFGSGTSSSGLAL